MLELYPCATSESFTTIGRALQSAQSVKELVIWPEIVGVLLLLTLREPWEQFRRRVHVLNVGVKCITRVIAQNGRTKPMEIHMGMVKLVEGIMLWEVENLTLTQTLLRLGSFDTIIGMDWLSKYHAVIVCDEKIVRIPYGDEVLIFQGDKCDGRNESRLNIISCTKTQKYLLKGCHVFLARITEKKTEEKSKEKRPKDVPVVQDFLEVFPGV
ncbi:putative reverse transcriptase domain-containing protein [Tanacetum coccineum]